MEDDDGHQTPPIEIEDVSLKTDGLNAMEQEGDNPFVDISKPWFGLLTPMYLAPIKVPIALVLVPFRITLLAVVLFLCMCWCKMCNMGTKLPVLKGDPPMALWRRRLIRPAVMLSQACILFLAGVFWIEHRRSKSFKAPPKGTKYVVVANHVTPMDGAIMNFALDCTFIAKKELISVPIFGIILKNCQAILVDRHSKDAKKEVLDVLRERVLDESGKWPRMCVFPEGTTTNGRRVIRFQKGVFTLGLPVRAMALQYPSTFTCGAYSCTWPLGGALPKIVGISSQAFNRAIITDLGIIEPTEEEKVDPIAFATRVQKMISEEIGVAPSELSYSQHPELVAIREKRRKAKEAEAEHNKIDGLHTPASTSPRARSTSGGSGRPRSASGGSEGGGGGGRPRSASGGSGRPHSASGGNGRPRSASGGSDVAPLSSRRWSLSQVSARELLSLQDEQEMF